MGANLKRRGLGGYSVNRSGTAGPSRGLAGRDPQIEQITRNVLTRLG
jgi:hypothetical protein